MDPWVICPNCPGYAIEVGPMQGIDCPNCGHITASQLLALARRRQREAKETKRTK